MAEIVSLLGANYTVWERWGHLIALALVLVLCVGGVAAVKIRRPLLRLIAALAAALAGAGLGCSAFVMRYIQAPLVPSGYRLTEVAFTGPAGRLGGEFLVPDTLERHPALVFVTGSDISSYRTNYAPLVNQLVAPAAARYGFALLYVDRRGVGRSTGDWSDAGIEDRASDLLAALAFLAAQPTVDPARLVVIGHSQGGWVAQRLARAPTPAAMVLSLAGPAVSVEEQTIDDEFGALTCDGRGEAMAEAEARALVADLRQRSSEASRGRLRQLQRIIDYRPDDALRAIAIPTVFVFAEHDRLVPAVSNRRRLDQIWADTPPPLATVYTVAGAGHSLRLSDRCGRNAASDAPFAPDVVAILDRALARVASKTSPSGAPLTDGVAASASPAGTVVLRR